MDLHSLESDVFGDHIGHNICMHHSRSLTPFPNFELLLPAYFSGSYVIGLKVDGSEDAEKMKFQGQEIGIPPGLDI